MYKNTYTVWFYNIRYVHYRMCPGVVNLVRQNKKNFLWFSLELKVVYLRQMNGGPSFVRASRIGIQI